ncbi:MAG: CYTH domain-containing protein [Patescibacteria group bacterium]|jgi:adenylate cyclase class IV
MIKVEVEHRGHLSQEKFDELTNLFRQKGAFLGTKKRFSLIYSTGTEEARDLKDETIDLRLRITNKQPEIVMKYGKWGGKDARKEYEFKLENGKYDDFIGFLKILGYTKYALMANTKYDYRYKDIIFSLVKVPGWGYYFEAEIMADEDEIEKSDKQLEAEIESLGLKVASEEEYYDLLNSMNTLADRHIDLEQTDFATIKAKYIDYFED